MSISPDQQIALLKRRCERILTEEDLQRKLASGRQLRIKYGMDPTAPDVHLGHAVQLRIIRQFQDWGHKAVIIIGDFTARVGDPSGRNTTRPILTPEQIELNANTYRTQIQRILLTDPDHLEVRHNSEWLEKMNLTDVLKLTSRKSIAQILQREDFAKRYTDGVDIRLHELLYPLLQGWDSVMIHSDVEMGGADQLFNCLVGREFQKEENQDAQVVFVTPILVGTDGSMKMSKSKANYIAIDDKPAGQNGKFGKIMSLPDSAMPMYYQLLTDIPESEYTPLITDHPRDAKIRLAKHIITHLHTDADATAAEAEFIQVFSKKQVPDDMPQFKVAPGEQSLAPLIVLASLAASNSEAMRKIREGAVSLDGEKVDDARKPVSITGPTVLKLGRKYARLVPDNS